MPSRESRESREQKRAVEARLGEGETEGVVEEEEGAERLGKVYGDGGGSEPDTSMLGLIAVVAVAARERRPAGWTVCLRHGTKGSESERARQWRRGGRNILMFLYSCPTTAMTG